MTDFERELKKRNARLRAWRAHGVPVLGVWEVPRLQGRFRPKAQLQLRCGPCGKTESVSVREQAQLLPFELGAVESIRDQGCPHLAPLLSDDPPEFLALYELELLAGDF